MTTMRRLEGQAAAVTGAGSGIGRAIALRFAAEGARVHALDLKVEAAQETVDTLAKAGGQGYAWACDVSVEASVNDTFERIGRVDILVNNAGVSSIGTVETTTPDELDRVYRVNVKGTHHCLRAVVPRLKAQGGGVILNMASIASKIGLADRFAYSMSKGAVLSMTLSVARDYVAAGIRCNCLCPARVHTPFVDSYLENHYKDNKAEMMQKLSAAQPLGRMGQPDEIAALAAFLCSPEASFITGSAYDIDGGVTLLR